MQRSGFPRIINPYSDDENSIRRSVITIQALVLVAVVGIAFAVTSNKALTFSLAVLLVISLLLAWRGIASPGQILTPFAIASVSTIFMLDGSGVHDVSVLGLAASIVIAGLLLGARGTAFFTFVSGGIVLAIGIAEHFGYFVPAISGPAIVEEIVVSTVILIVVGLSLRSNLVRLAQIATISRENETAQIAANKELTQLKNSLEKRIAERTKDLEKRANQLETISKVARSISNINELEQLLPAIANVVSEQFGFYHTGIFMLDERAEFAVLEAANSEGGQRMLKRGHRLRVGATGIVGYVAGQGEARIALDVGSDAVFFNNPDLPNTRSEMALPLKAGADVIGVLDVQSTETNAFQTEDIKVLTTLANQVAVAIENSRLFGQTRKALAESQLVYDEYIRQEWSRFGHRLGKLGFVYDGIRTIPITTPDANQADATRIPIKIRGVTVGSIAIHSNDSSRQWTQDEIGLARAAAERAGLAIENLRLLDEAQRRASKERTIGDISSRLASSIDLNEIMATAVQELGRTLPDSEIILQFTNPEKS